MRLRASVLCAATAAGLLVPLATPANAVTTTSTIVAYTADVNGNGIAELYTRPADGSGVPARVFQNTEDVWLPSLSPDGTKIAYLMNDAAVNGFEMYRLYVRSLSAPYSSDPGTLLLNLDVTASVGWSRDGTKIVASAINWTTFAFGTYIVNSDGSLEPTPVGTTEDVYGEEPSFSPSGTQIAIDVIDDDGNYVGIDLITLETGKRARIAGTTGGSDPVWSPDGQYILFQKYLPSCGVGLYRVPAGGGTPVAFHLAEGRFLGSAEYSRDGSQVFWADSPMKSCGTTAKGDIWVGTADLSGVVVRSNLTNTPTVYEYGTTVAGGTLASDTTPPAAPVIATTGSIGATSAGITWTADGDATDFIVLRKPQGDPAPTSTSDGTLVYHGPAHAATATGLTTGTAYDFYVFAIDASGNMSGVSAAHSARPTAPPVMSAIARVGIGTTTTAFNVNWTGSTPTFQLQVGEKKKSASGAWSTGPSYTTLVASTPDKTYAFTGAQARTYYFKARGFDEYGNATAYATPSVVHVPIDERWSGFTYSAGWVSKSAADRYLGTYRTSITRGASVSTRADTSRFTIIGDKCSTCGKFEVWIDGVRKATVDTYSSTPKVRQILYSSGVYSAIKPHSIRIVVLGTSGRPRVSLDALQLRR
jgi:hypothetical protein